MRTLRKPRSIIILAGLLCPALLFAVPAGNAAPLGSETTPAERWENVPGLEERGTADVGFRLIAGGRRESREFRDVSSEVVLVAVFLGAFLVTAGFFAGR